MKKIALLMALLFLVAAFVGCSPAANEEGTADSGQEGAAASGEAGYKDTITVAINTDHYPDDPHNNTGNHRILTMLYNRLVKRNPDNEIVPDAAESWECSEDGLTWTFYLKQGIKFHNGKEMTANDVKASFDRLTNEEDPLAYTSSFAFIESTNVIDDYTVEIKLKYPVAPMLANLTATQASIMDADIIAEYGRDIGTAPENTIGTGPYMMVNRITDQEVNLVANENYFEGAPLTKNLKFLVVKEESSRSIALETGEVDIITSISPSETVRLDALDGFHAEITPSVGQHNFCFNYTHPIIKDPKIRQAINYCIDHQAIIDALWSEVGYTACTSALSPNVWGYVDLGVIEQDYDKAKELLAEAGYPDGFTFQAIASSIYAKNGEVLEMIAEQLKPVGIIVDIQVIDSTTFSSMQTLTPEQAEFGMICCGLGPSSADAHEAYARSFITPDNGMNGSNIGFYSNAEVDALIEQGAQEMDEEKRLDIYKRIQEIIYLEDPGGIWVYDTKNINVMTDNVEGYELDIRGMINFQKMRIKE